MGVELAIRQLMHTPSRRQFDRFWANLPLRVKGLVVVAIPLLAVLVTACSFLIVWQQMKRADDRIKHSLQVEYELQGVVSRLVDAQNGVRGYLLTEKDEFLDPYREARKALPGHQNRLRTLIADNPSQTQRLRRMEPLIEERLALMDEILKYSAAPGSARPRPPQELLVKAKNLTDTVRRAADAMQDTEQLLLSLRAAQEQSISRRTGITILTTTLFGLLGGVLAALLFTKGVVQRVQHLAENAGHLAAETPLLPAMSGRDEIGHLEQRLVQASELLAQRRRELQESQSRLQAIFDSTQDAILLVNDEGRYVDANPAAVALFGYSREELLQRHIWDGALPTHQETGLALWQVFIAEDGQSGQSGEGTLVRKDDSTVVAEYRAVANIVPGLHLSVMRDITRRKQAETALRQAKEEAEQANHAKSDFLSRMSHELRTPLNAILGFAQVLEMDGLNPDQRESVNHILKGGRHLLELINEVLDISRIETGRLAISLEPVDVNEVMQEAVDLIGSLAAVHNIRLHEVSCHHYVLADRQRLKQVLLNLISNAVKYNSVAGSVTVTCVVAGDNEPSDDAPSGEHTARLRLSVSDTGAGIPPENLNRLFNPFERLGAEKSGIEGTGIGLALSKRLVELMNGVIGVQSTPGQGSTFWLELPLVETPAAETPDAASGAEVNGNLRRAERTILYVEDNLPNLRLIERILARRDGIELISAMQGRIGLDLAREHQPNLILLDLHLPDINGDEFLRQLQADRHTSHIPVVMLSADATPGQIERLLKPPEGHSGARAYLTKPLDVRRFLDVLDETLH